MTSRNRSELPELSNELRLLFEAASKHCNDAFAQQRVLRGVYRRLSKPAGFSLRSLTTIGVVVTATTTAAAFTARYVAEANEIEAPVQTAVSPLPKPAQQPPGVAPASSPEVDVAEPHQAEPADSKVAPRLPASTPPSAPKPPPRTSAGKAGEDPTRVAEAFNALRNQNDPARANRLLKAYLQNNPKGALSEDALALLIEASVAAKDPRAKRHARRYLRQYPNGKHRALAARIASK